MEDDCEQEIMVMQSIYENKEELCFWTDQEGTLKGVFRASVKLPSSFHISAPKTVEAESGADKGGRLFPVTFLPPVELNIVLPSCYPSKKPPFYTLACAWLTRHQLTTVCQHLDQLWAENCGSVILYNWFLFLEQDMMDFLKVKSPLELFDEEAHLQSSGLNTEKEDTNDAQSSGEAEKKDEVNFPGLEKHRQDDPDIVYDYKDAEFEIDSPSLERGVQMREPSIVDDEADLDPSQFYICYCADPCRKCPMSRDGLDCRTVQHRRVSVARLLCSLLSFNKMKEEERFCRSTVQCSVCITEQLGHLCMRFEGCHHAFCKTCLREYFTLKIKEGGVKSMNCLSLECYAQAHPSQVKALVSKEQYERYERLLLQSTLDTMGDIVYCPRRQCQSPVIRTDDLGRCPRCYYAFCVQCTRDYHGTQPCAITPEEIRKVHARYQNGNKQVKEMLEKRYGKRALNHALQEVGTLEWMEENTRPCPKCRAKVQKVEGCNLVTCTCGAKFCWLCGKPLVTEDPYAHFFQAGGQCYGKTFYGVDPNFEEEEFADYELNQNDWAEMGEEDWDWEEEEWDGVEEEG
ncbi:E3 ubiquitin-protein ligase RNF14-like [Babylonia areolata]|uniref:E3 ubiquitin-protein ligase RNF14-like n=1 Tax=Babylonia areolata TaxID=304850 RepID=UPI003FD613AB